MPRRIVSLDKIAIPTFVYCRRSVNRQGVETGTPLVSRPGWIRLSCGSHSEPRPSQRHSCGSGSRMNDLSVVLATTYVAQNNVSDSRCILRGDIIDLQKVLPGPKPCVFFARESAHAAAATQVTHIHGGRRRGPRPEKTRSRDLGREAMGPPAGTTTNA